MSFIATVIKLKRYNMLLGCKIYATYDFISAFIEKSQTTEKNKMKTMEHCKR